MTLGWAGGRGAARPDMSGALVGLRRIRKQARACWRPNLQGQAIAPDMWRLEKVPLGGSLRLQADVIVHGTSEPLLASEVAFGSLHLNVPQQKLALLQLPTGGVAETRTGTAAIMGRQFGNPGLRSSGFHHMPYHLLRDAVTPDRLLPADAPEQPPFRDRRRRRPFVNRRLHQSGTGTVRMCAALPTRSAITQCSSRCWR